MKDLAKTGIALGIVFFMFFIYFLIIGNVENGVNFFTRTNLNKNDEKVTTLYERINGNNSLRKAKLVVNDDLTSDDVVLYVFDHLKDDDYKTKKYEAEKIVCQVTNSISFYTDSKSCKVMIIDHQVFYDYQKELYNIDTNIDFKDIDYHGYSCKTDKKNYYCLKSSYDDGIVGYSAFKEAYEEKNTIVLYEFYLRVDLNDEEMCLKYFDDEYCKDSKKDEKREIDEDVIVNNGVLYRHVFRKSDDNYYLEESAIVAER